MEESPVPPMQCMRDNFIQGDLFGQWNRWHIDYQVNGLNQFLDVIRDLVIRYGCYCGQPDCLHTPDDPKEEDLLCNHFQKHIMSQTHLRLNIHCNMCNHTHFVWKTFVNCCTKPIEDKIQVSKKKRGRPPKTLASQRRKRTFVSSTSLSPLTKEQPVRKGPGRPRKNITSTTGSQQMESDKDDASQQENRDMVERTAEKNKVYPFRHTAKRALESEENRLTKKNAGSKQDVIEFPDCVEDCEFALLDVCNALANKTKTCAEMLEHCESVQLETNSFKQTQLAMVFSDVIQTLQHFFLTKSIMTIEPNSQQFRQISVPVTIVDSAFHDVGCGFKIEFSDVQLYQAMNYGELCLLQVTGVNNTNMYTLCVVYAKQIVYSSLSSGPFVLQLLLRSSHNSGRPAVNNQQPVRFLSTRIILTAYTYQARALLNLEMDSIIRQLEQPNLVCNLDIDLFLPFELSKGVTLDELRCLQTAWLVCCQGQNNLDTDLSSPQIGFFDGYWSDQVDCSAKFVRLFLDMMNSLEPQTESTGMLQLPSFLLIGPNNHWVGRLCRKLFQYQNVYNTCNGLAFINGEVVSQESCHSIEAKQSDTPNFLEGQQNALIRLFAQNSDQLDTISMKKLCEIDQQLQTSGKIVNDAESIVVKNQLRPFLLSTILARDQCNLICGSFQSLFQDPIALGLLQASRQISSPNTRPTVALVFGCQSFTDAQLLSLCELGCRRFLLFDHYQVNQKIDTSVFNRAIKGHLSNSAKATGQSSLVVLDFPKSDSAAH